MFSREIPLKNYEKSEILPNLHVNKLPYLSFMDADWTLKVFGSEDTTVSWMVTEDPGLLG